MRDRLYRSRDDRILAGVCGGIADWMDLDPSLVRIVFALLVITGGIGLILYIIMAIVVPEEPYLPLPMAPAGATPGGTPAPAPTGATPDGSDATTSTAGAAAVPGQASATGSGAPNGWNQPSAWATDREARRAARRAAHYERRADRDGRAGLIFGAILVIVGAWFLLRRYIPAFDTDFVGPVVLIAIGVIVLAGALGRSSNDDASRPR